MSDFFISYTQSDREWAEWIAWVLKEAGYTVQLQAWDFRPGDNFISKLQRVVSEADRTILVVSPDYLKSTFGEAEWTAALAQDPKGEKGKLLPVQVRKAELPGLLAPIIYIDLVGVAEPVAQERLLAGLSRGRVSPNERPQFPGGVKPGFPGGTPTGLGQAGARPLPLAKLPEPGPLPPGSRMPLTQNPLFVGRRKDLLRLARHLNKETTAALGQVAAITGLGGIGKTQLASEFVYRYGRFFEGGVFWMSFADRAAVPSEVAACGRSLGLHPDFDNLPLDRQVALVREAWQRPLARLLVFDNCEEPALLREWRPAFGGCRVLITCRRAHWDRSLGVQTLPLGTLSRATSLELLCRFRPDLADDSSALDGVADELGDLPLALHLAGSFLARYKEAASGDPVSYVERLRKGDLLNHPSLQGRGAEHSPTFHETHVARTFAISYEQLDPSVPTDASARRLLARAACFSASEPIPRALLLLTLQLKSADPEEELLAEDALWRLVELGLLDAGEQGSVLLHRLVAKFASNQGLHAGDRTAVEVVVLEEAKRLNKEGFPAPLLAWQSHLRVITDAAASRDDELAGHLCNSLGYHLWRIGRYQEALVYFQRVLAIRAKLLGLNHPDTAASLNNLGFLLKELGDLSGARPYFEQALAIREASEEPDYKAVAVSLNNLGFLLRDLGKLAEAKSHFERALAIREEVLGAEHRDTAASLSNLGNLYSELGEFIEARPYFERALSILEKVLGPEHPETAMGLNNLGYLLQNLGDFAGAKPYYERALIIREKALGPEHPLTARVLNNLGSLFRDLGDHEASRTFHESALEIQERVLGSEHPETAESLHNLGNLLQDLGELEQASMLLRRALVIREQILGAEHPSTAATLGSIGRLSHLLGARDEALMCLERAVAIQERVLGRDHPRTKTARSNLERVANAPMISLKK